MRTIIADTEIGLCTELDTFCREYPNYKDILNIDTVVISNLCKTNVVLQMINKQNAKVQLGANTFTAFKNLLLRGNGTDVINGYPVLVTYPAVMPPICEANVEAQLRHVIQLIVATKKLTEEMGIALGIVKLINVADISQGTPDLTVKNSSGGHPIIHCTMGDYDDYEIWKSTGTGFVLLSVSSKPKFIDNSALPVIGVHALWVYKTIYRYKNVQIGNWSQAVSIAVYGTV